MIQLVFTQAPDILSYLIRWVTRSTVSHVGIQIGPDRIIHADRDGIQDDTISTFLTCNGQRKIVATYALKPDLEPHINTEKIIEFVGEPYDYEGMLWMGVSAFTWTWFKIRLSNPLANDNEFYCSEFVIKALQTASDDPNLLPEIKKLDAEVTAPGSLLRAVSKGSSFSLS